MSILQNAISPLQNNTSPHPAFILAQQSSALLKAASEDNLEALIFALDHGAAIESADSLGFTSLLKTSRHGRLELARELLSRGANVNACTSRKNTALMYAAGGGHTQVVELLLMSKARVNFFSEHEDTALMWAAMGGYLDTVQLLLKHGASLMGANRDGVTALICAAQSGNGEIVKLFLSQSCGQAIVNTQNIFGQSALHIAAKNNATEVCKALLTKADSCLCTRDGASPASLATDPPLVALLTKHMDKARARTLELLLMTEPSKKGKKKKRNKKVKSPPSNETADSSEEVVLSPSSEEAHLEKAAKSENTEQAEQTLEQKQQLQEQKQKPQEILPFISIPSRPSSESLAASATPSPPIVEEEADLTGFAFPKTKKHSASKTFSAAILHVLPSVTRSQSNILLSDSPKTQKLGASSASCSVPAPSTHSITTSSSAATATTSSTASVSVCRKTFSSLFTEPRGPKNNTPISSTASTSTTASITLGNSYVSGTQAAAATTSLPSFASKTTALALSAPVGVSMLASCASNTTKATTVHNLAASTTSFKDSIASQAPILEGHDSGNVAPCGSCKCCLAHQAILPHARAQDLDLRVHHFAGQGIESLSFCQLQALEEMHAQQLNTISDAKFQLSMSQRTDLKADLIRARGEINELRSSIARLQEQSAKSLLI